ncbi:YacP-like NYN domain protein [Posidoniimonas polymericola]|uniref:YacP-like NYN domain protein n=1 Tax=Posidoniimonas polymericola TaxID=2528002 RepID=A0A5C5YCF9_9BACT|nr:NYN domain-containing protein [Posidoniimonas polymericola]TWT72784.1 YacP-like NYN domain protein [Posidoniimonas polymericola]
MARSPARVRLLIDGYNLLHATDVHGSDRLAGTLQGAREALLAFIASRLVKRERARATIVFDAAGALPGLPDEYSYEGIHVLFARKYPDADAMLEALVESDRAPKELLVISGDRRVQRAARRRGAAWQGSAEWNRELRGRRPHAIQGQAPEKQPPADVGDAAFWVSEFSLPLPEPEPQRPTPTPPKRLAARPSEEGAANAPSRGAAEPLESAESPFPPGYAEDLAAELEKTDRRPLDDE